MSDIKPHDVFDSIRPDEVGECWNGVMAVPGLYEALWNSMQDMKPLGELIDIEESAPGDAIGLNTVTSVWDKFTDEHKLNLNRLAGENSFSTYDWS